PALIAAGAKSRVLVVASGEGPGRLAGRAWPCYGSGAMPRSSRSSHVILSLAAALTCHFVLAGCRAAPDAATADVTVVYRGQQLSGSRIAARLGQEAQVDTLTEDGHSAAVKL